MCIYTGNVCATHCGNQAGARAKFVAAIFRNKYLKERQGMDARATSRTGGADRRVPNVSQVFLLLFRTQAQSEIRV